MLKIKHIYIDLYEIWAELWFFKTDMYSYILELRENRREFLNGVFCILLSRPFDKINMTLGQGQWPRVTRRTGVNQCALLMEKSVDIRFKWSKLNIGSDFFTIFFTEALFSIKKVHKSEQKNNAHTMLLFKQYYVSIGYLAQTIKGNIMLKRLPKFNVTIRL